MYSSLRKDGRWAIWSKNVFRFSNYKMIVFSLATEYTEEIGFLEAIDWCPVWNAAVGFDFIDLARGPVVFYTTAPSVF